VCLYLRPDGFAQTHITDNEVLVAAALELLDARPHERVLELFGGNGNFSFGLAQRAREVWMVEGAPLGVALARRSADEARVSNLRLVSGDVTRVVQGLAGEGQQFSRILADPPRAGFTGLAQAAASLKTERVVYVACDPLSLARDARHLVGQGFAPRDLQVLDLFPQTRHVEALLSFERT
jgi:23S rRNA (uracil1939-C5)-methyltransferase